MQKLFIITNINPHVDIIEAYAKNKIGIKSNSTFHIHKEGHENNITGNLQLNHYEHGIIIQFAENEMSGMKPFFTFEKNGDIYRHELTSISHLVHASNIFSPLELADVTEIKVYYENPTPTEIFKIKQWGNVIYPDSIFNITLINDQLRIRGVQNTFYDTVYMWAKPIHVDAPLNGVLMSNAYKVYPDLIPYNKEIQLEIAINENQFPEHLSIYY